MILRLILVGLVTSMGFELPSSRDVSSWVESSRAWAYSRTADRTASGLPVVATEVATDYHAADADAAFLAAQGDSLAAFQVAEATPVAAPLAEAPALDPAPATAEVVEAGTGLSDGEEMAVASLLADDSPVAEPTTLVASRPEPAPAACEDPAPTIAAEMAAGDLDPADELDAAPTRGERLATAVRLTREAAQAWAAVIDEPAAAEATDLDSIDAR